MLLSVSDVSSYSLFPTVDSMTLVRPVSLGSRRVLPDGSGTSGAGWFTWRVSLPSPAPAVSDTAAAAIACAVSDMPRCCLLSIHTARP